jgi:cytochrome c
MARFLVCSTALAVMVGALAGGHAALAADAEAGKKIFARCAACHNVDKPQNKVGPTLIGLFGREAGTVEGFKYSDANKDSHVIWDEATLDEYLADPKAYMPGNRMAFPGLKNAEDRANVIAYLKEATKQ